MDIKLCDGLLYTAITISYRGIEKKIDNIVIDTGAAETIISPDIVEDMGIIVEESDSVNSFYGVGGSLHNFFSKQIEDITISNRKIYNPNLDFGIIDPKGKINGLLGLDILLHIGAIIDLKNLKIEIN